MKYLVGHSLGLLMLGASGVVAQMAVQLESLRAGPRSPAGQRCFLCSWGKGSRYMAEVMAVGADGRLLERAQVSLGRYGSERALGDRAG